MFAEALRFAAPPYAMPFSPLSAAPRRIIFAIYFAASAA